MSRRSRRLARTRLEASFADDAGSDAAADRRLHALGDELLPECPAPALLRWLRTRACCAAGARAGLRPPLLLPRAARACPSGSCCSRAPRARSRCKGAVPVGATGVAASAALRAGDVVVVELDGSAASLRGLDRIVADARRPRGSGPSRCPRSTAVCGRQREQHRRAREHRRADDEHQPATASSGTPPSGVCRSLAEQRAAPAPPAPRLSHEHDRRDLDRRARCSALISLSSPTTEAAASPAPRAAASAVVAQWRSSAASWLRGRSRRTRARADHRQLRARDGPTSRRT